MQGTIKLNDNDLDLLRKIFEYGGYTTSLSVNTYRSDITSVAVFYTLKKLTEGGYLKEIPFYSDSRKNALVYQVTAKTCKLFDNPHSYYRKRHEDSYIIRALIKQHFLFEICREFNQSIIAENDKRIRFLAQELGFDEGLLPKKYNKSVPLTHVEEYIIDSRTMQGKELYCKSSGESIYRINEKSGLIIIHIDKATANVAAQLMSLIERYRPLLELNKIKIDFLAVVDSKKREYSYTKAIERIAKQQSLQERLIQLHTRILLNNLGVEPGKVSELPAKIREKYSAMENITSEDTYRIPIDEMQKDCIAIVNRLIDEIISLKCKKEEKLSRVTELFRKLYRLAAAGMIQDCPTYTIGIYRIGYKFSIS